MNGLIGTREAATRLNVSVRRVQALIAVGRLPAEKIGSSYAIREDDLGILDGRKNGRTPRSHCPAGMEQIPAGNLDTSFKEGQVPVLKTERRKINIDKRILEKSPEDRTPEEWNAILDKILGSVALGPPDLSSNKKKYLNDLGREKYYRR